MFLKACIALALLALAGAQSDASTNPSVSGSLFWNTPTIDGSANTAFVQPFVTDGSGIGNAPLSNEPSGNSDQPTATQQSTIFNSLVNSVLQQQTQQQTQTFFTGIESSSLDVAAATSQQSGSLTNLFSLSSVPLMVPSSALQQTGVSEAATQQAADISASATQLTAIPASATQQVDLSASATQQTVAITASATMPTDLLASATQPEQHTLSVEQQQSSFATNSQQTPTTVQQMSSSANVVQQSATQQSLKSTFVVSTTIKSTDQSLLPTNLLSSPFFTAFKSASSTNPPTVFPTEPTNLQSTVFPTVSTVNQVSTTTTSAPLDTPTHVQIIFNNSYTRTVENGVSGTDYCDGLAPLIAAAAEVPLYRITNVTVNSQPQTDFLVLRFTVQPFISTGSTTVQQAFATFFPVQSQQPFTDSTVGQIVEKLRLKVLFGPEFRLVDQNSKVLTVDRNSNDKIFVSWTDNGPCPNDPCKTSEICVCSLTGTLQCQHQNQPKLLLLLLLLLLIPLVIIIIIIICVRVKRDPGDKKKAEKRMIRADMLSYHEYVAREHDPQQPKVATIASRSTLNEGTLNTLYRSLGENISIAFNGTTFVDNSGLDNSDNTSRDAILPGGK